MKKVITLADLEKAENPEVLLAQENIFLTPAAQDYLKNKERFSATGKQEKTKEEILRKIAKIALEKMGPNTSAEELAAVVSEVYQRLSDPK